MNAPLHSPVTVVSGNATQPGDPVSEILLPKVNAPTAQELVSQSIADGNIDKLIAAQRTLDEQASGIALLTPGALHMLGA